MTATLRKSAPVPDHVPAHLVRYFNYRTDPAFLRDPYAAIDALRETRAFWTTYEGGYWVLTRAEDIQGAMRQPDLFSNDTRVFRLLASYASPKAKADKADLAKMLTVLDRPEHGMYRRVIAQRFMPKVIETMRPDVTAICTGLIEPLVKKGHCDFIDAFASRFPTTVFLRLMGLPLGDSDRFLGWANKVLFGSTMEEVKAAQSQIMAYLAAVIEERSQHPSSDLISYLLAGRVEDRPITKHEVLDFCVLLFVAGLDTVATSLGLIFNYLAEHPEARQELAGHPERLPDAVEELMRLVSPVQQHRRVTRDVEYAGVQMKAGDELLIFTASASRDPEVFANAAKADLHRNPNSHTAFGAGPHICLGIHLARQEIAVAIQEWLARIPEFAKPAEFEPTYRGGGIIGLTRLDFEWPVNG